MVDLHHGRGHRGRGGGSRVSRVHADRPRAIRPCECAVDHQPRLRRRSHHAGTGRGRPPQGLHDARRAPRRLRRERAGHRRARGRRAPDRHRPAPALGRDSHRHRLRQGRAAVGRSLALRAGHVHLGDDDEPHRVRRHVPRRASAPHRRRGATRPPSGGRPARPAPSGRPPRGVHRTRPPPGAPSPTRVCRAAPGARPWPRAPRWSTRAGRRGTPRLPSPPCPART